MFRLNPNGSGYSILRSFGGSASDGNDPEGGVVIGGDGALYGSTASGGNFNLGTVFKLQTNGLNYQVMRNFSGGINDGGQPKGRLLAGLDGFLYGVSIGGGMGAMGTVFRMNTNVGGSFAVLHSFTGGDNDGSFPQAELVQSTDGTLYGMTPNGGAGDNGTIFKLSPTGQNYAVLRQFNGLGGDGGTPLAGLVIGPTGDLYGATYTGNGTNSGCIFRMNTIGTTFTEVYNFSGSGPDGGSPQMTLVVGRYGALFGTTSGGGQLRYGSVFSLSSPTVIVSGVQVSVAGAQVNFTGGESGMTYAIQATETVANPNSWQSIGTAQASQGGTFQFLDNTTASHLRRFYRTTTVLPP